MLSPTMRHLRKEFVRLGQERQASGTSRPRSGRLPPTTPNPTLPPLRPLSFLQPPPSLPKLHLATRTRAQFGGLGAFATMNPLPSSSSHHRLMTFRRFLACVPCPMQSGISHQTRIRHSGVPGSACGRRSNSGPMSYGTSGRRYWSPFDGPCSSTRDKPTASTMDSWLVASFSSAKNSWHMAAREALACGWGSPSSQGVILSKAVSASSLLLP